MLKYLCLVLLGALLMSEYVTADTGATEKTAAKKIAVIGHRGASEVAPENTLASWDLAAKMKADWGELDVQLTKDGEVIVCHDPKVDRTSNGKGLIKDLTLAEIKKLDAGSWKDPKYAGERFPTLREALELSRRDHIGLYIEIKDISEKKDRALEQQLIKLAGKRTLKDAAFASEAMKAIEASGTPNLELTRKTIALVRETGMQKQVVIQSFAPVACAVTRIEAPELRDEYLGSRNEKKPKDWQTFLRFDKILDIKGCNIQDKSLTAEMVQRFHKEGRTVAVWTVDKEDEIKRFVDMGVDSVITNRPDVCLKLLQELGRR